MSLPRFFFLLFVLPLMGSGEEPSESNAAQATKTREIPVAVDGINFEKDYIERQILRYEALVADYQREVQSLLKRKVEEKRRLIEMKYQSPIRKEMESETASRDEAIVLFENFIRKYWGNADFVPSAMYRLAELYYERSMIEHEKRMDEYDRLMTLYEKGKLAQEPEMPIVDLEPSIALYREIVLNYRDFRYLGEVYYMLGYCLDVSKQKEEAVKVWEEMVEKNISSEYTAEVYMRIGEYYFSEKNDLRKALDAFMKSAQYKDYKDYDKVVYKIAWTYYRMNDFDRAIETFASLIFYADEMKRRGLSGGQDMRRESVQYIAISFADEEWGSVDKAVAYFNKIDGKSFEFDVFDKLGKYYYENANYAQAEKAYRFVLARHPYNESAPKIHEKLIQMYNKQGMLDKMQEEIERFTKLYDEESEWALKNRANATALRNAAQQAKDFLVGSAGYHQKLAQQAKEKGDFEKAKSEYAVAAQLYGKYLEKFPYTSEGYDISYNFADCLYFSGQIARAVLIYERIRDDKNQDRLKNDAGLATYLCYSALWENAPERQIKSEEKRGTPLSKLEEKLIESSDIYLQIAKDAADRSAVAYNSARIFYDHGMFDESEKRYLRIINEFPDSEAAVYAARDIIGAYNEKKDWVNVAKWSKLLTDRLSQAKSPKSREITDEFKTYRGAALFKYAEQLQEEKKHREAADEYLRIVEENPYHQDADKALFNAAYNFEKALMFDSAMTIHERIYREYPYSPIAPQSLFLVAYNAERSYNFEKALDAYLLLYKKYPTNEKRLFAIYNAALLLERLKRYREAATYYMLYAREQAEKFDGKEAAYFAGLMHQKAEDWQGMISRFEQFIDTYRDDPEVQNLVLRAYYQIAKTYEEKMGDWKRAKETYAKILSHYQAKKVESDEANAYAAEAEFKLIEDDFIEYEKLKIGGQSLKKLEESLKAKKAASQSLGKRYGEILKYKSEWSYAALYRQGNILQLFAEALINTPIPKEIEKDQEAVDMYQQMLDEQIAPLEQQAVDIYVSTLERAREGRIFNKWTTLIIERLSKLRPQEFRAGKTPRYGVNTTFESGYPVMLTLDRPEKKVYKRAGIKKEEKPTGEEPRKEE